MRRNLQSNAREVIIAKLAAILGEIRPQEFEEVTACAISAARNSFVEERKRNMDVTERTPLQLLSDRVYKDLTFYRSATKDTQAKSAKGSHKQEGSAVSAASKKSNVKSGHGK